MYVQSAWISLLAVVLVAGTQGLAQNAAPSTRCWTVDTAASELIVHVRPAGLLSAALHAHHFVPAQWRGRVCFNPNEMRGIDLEIAVQADSLEDRQDALSEDDLATVERQVQGPEVLDAARYPVIRYTAGRLSVSERGRQRLSGHIEGELSLHGHTRGLEVPVTAQWNGQRLRATGEVAFRQSDFGIEPYSRFLGTVGVDDRVTVEFAIDGVPAAP